MNTTPTTHATDDRGGGLIVVVVLVTVLAFVGLAVAELTSTTLRTSSSADRHLGALAAAEGGARRAMLELWRGSTCAPPAGFDVNGATLDVSCRAADNTGCTLDIRSIASIGAVSRVVDVRFRADGTIVSWLVASPDSAPYPGPVGMLGPTC